MSDVTVVIGVDSTGAVKGVKSVTDEVDKGTSKLGGMGKAFGDIGKIASGFVIGQGLLKLPGLLTGAATAAAEDAAATARLDQALKNAGGSFDSNKAKVDARIASMQKLAFSDDDVRDSFQTLLAATGDVDESLRRQALAADVARGANIPLQKASLLLGKVTAENVEQFRRMGITIGEGASEAEAFAALQAKFGGQSEAYAKSTAGQFEQLKIRMAEAKETLGSALLPVMVAVGDVLMQKVVPAVESFAQKVGPALSQIGAVLEQHVLPPLQKLAEWFTGNESAMQAAAAAIGGVLVAAFAAWAVSAGAAAAATIIALAPILAIVAAVALLSAGIFLLIKHWDDLTAKYPALGAASDAIKAKFQEFAGWIQSTLVPAIMRIADVVQEAGQKAIGFVQTHWGTIKGILEGYAKAWAVVIEAAWKQIQIYVETALRVIQGVIDVVMGAITGDWQRSWDGIKQILSAAWDGLVATVRNGIELIKGLAPLMLAAGATVMEAFKSGLMDIWHTKVVPFVTSLPGEMVRLIGDLGSLLWQKGRDLIQGFINGMKSVAIPSPSSLIPGVGGLVGLGASILPLTGGGGGGEMATPTGAYGQNLAWDGLRNAWVYPGTEGSHGNAQTGYGKPQLGGPAIINLVVDGAVLASVVTNELARSM